MRPVAATGYIYDSVRIVTENFGCYARAWCDRRCIKSTYVTLIGTGDVTFRVGERFSQGRIARLYGNGREVAHKGWNGVRASRCPTLTSRMTLRFSPASTFSSWRPGAVKQQASCHPRNSSSCNSQRSCCRARRKGSDGIKPDQRCASHGLKD